MVHVKLNNEKELLELAKEMLHIITNLRYWSNEWNIHHGAVLLNQKKKWEAKADALLERLKTTRSVHKYDVHIKLGTDEDKVGENGG